MIGRYTKNITVLYDGDPAGIKASLRGIDLILEEGMNVRVVLFPDGDDPDSFAKKVSTQELKDYLAQEAVDFISFKTKLLLKDTERDPIKKAGLIHDIVDTIAKVPDAIMRSAYLRQTSDLMEMEETVLISELNKLLRQKAAKQAGNPIVQAQENDLPLVEVPEDEPVIDVIFDTTRQEEEIIRILLEFADHRFLLVEPDAEVNEEDNNVVRVKDFIVNEIFNDGFYFSNAQLAGLFAEFAVQVEKDIPYDQQQFFAQLSPEIKPVAVTMVTYPYELANWESKGITVVRDANNLTKAVMDPIIYLKKKQLLKMRIELQEEIKARDKGQIPYDDLLERDRDLINLQSTLNKYTNTIIQR
jgi:DNA primase